MDPHASQASLYCVLTGEGAAVRTQHNASALDVRSCNEHSADSSMLSMSLQRRQLKDEMGRAADMLLNALKT